MKQILQYEVATVLVNHLLSNVHIFLCLLRRKLVFGSIS